MTPFPLRAKNLLAAGALLIAVLGSPAHAQTTPARFYPDDPLAAEPAPLPATDPQKRALSAVLETINNNLKTMGQRHPANGVIEAGGVNTLDEVMDGDWYVNRHGTRRLTTEELQRGPGRDHPPSATGPFKVLVVKPFGLNPGLLISDEKNDLYLLRFDPRGYVGLATGAQVVSSLFFHALGYYVTENYIVHFDRSRLVDHEGGQAVSSGGNARAIAEGDVDRFLRDVPQAAGGQYRAVAIRLPENLQALLGPYQVWGTRSDDPNDTVPHEHRRDLRGMFVFAAWLNASQMRAVATQDFLVNTGGVPHIRHYIVDLTKSLGSGVYDEAKLAWEGRETVLPAGGTIGKNIAGLGLVSPAWMRQATSGLREVGALGSSAFDPEAWTPADPMPPFENRLPDDTFWAAKKVMAFTDEDIRAIVQAGQYSRSAEDWITAALIERRNRIGRAYFSRVLPLDRLRIDNGRLVFDDLAVHYGMAAPRAFTIEWHAFANGGAGLLARLSAGPELPPAAAALPPGGYVAARITGGVEGMTVTAYVRREATGFRVIGVERAWPGRVVVTPPAPERADRRAFEDLAPRQRDLFQTYTTEYNGARGTRYSNEEVFERLTASEQTTFYGITHAALHSTLTDAQGAPLGLVIDRIDSIERIAGQYAGKGGDQQFRLYVRLKPDTREVLEKSREFFRDHENTVYHIGYPQSFRQDGKEPNMQFSLSEDGQRADIDVDYRSSRSPQALFNGHLTAANSDVRAGDNPELHGGRWAGLIIWWQGVFGKVASGLPKDVDVMSMARTAGPATPLPPNRPTGAAPDKIEDAVQEFLTDWLVRNDYDAALAFASPQAYACLTLGDQSRGQPLDAAAARRELLTLMEYSAAQLGRQPNLTAAIEAFVPRDPNRPIVDHAFKREFLLGPLDEHEARQYLCDPSAASAGGATGEYYGAVFNFRRDGGGTLGLLWTRENGQWRIVSYQPLTP